MYKTLVISPHCDDEVLGCGGILSNRPDDSFVYYLGVDIFHIVNRDIRLKEVSAVSNYLRFHYRVGNNMVNSYSKQSIINEITDVINEIQPKEIFIPFGGAYNQDHKEVYDACIIALRPHDQNHFVPDVYVYEVEQYILWGENGFEPNYFESIDIQKKINAYKLYTSQVRAMRPPELLEKFSAIRGMSSNTEYAESFKIIRKVNDLSISKE